MSLDLNAALSLEAIVVRYGTTLAVDEASFDLTPGRVLALLGPNGAGKSSLLQVCEGFRCPDSGRAAVFGVDPYEGRDWLMPKVGIMLQSGGVHPAARAGEVLRLFASFAAHPLDVDMLIDRLDLGRFANTAYRRLSGGEKQRLALALAIVGRPRLVFLDEPTAGMDAHARRTTWELIGELRRDGVSVLLTTHMLDEAEHLADDVVIIHRGRIIATGSPAQLTAAAGVEQLEVDADPHLPIDGLRSLLPAGVRVSETVPGRYTVDGPIDAHLATAVLGWLAGKGAHLTGIQGRRRTLEDVFLTLTRTEDDR